MSLNELVNPTAPLSIRVKQITFAPSGAVTQLTSTATAVTSNFASGVISCFTSTAAAGVVATFTLTNSQIIVGSRVAVSISAYGGTTGIPVVWSSAVAAGSCTINVANAAPVAALNGVVSVFFRIN